MDLREALILAIGQIKINKLRTFLVLLSITLGVVCVILVTSLGTSTEKLLQTQISSLYNRVISLTPNNSLSSHQWARFTKDDADYLKNASLGIEKIICFNPYNLIVRMDNEAQVGTVYATEPDAVDLTNIRIKYGRFINESDILNRERVVVVGEAFLDILADTEDYTKFIGKDIFLDDRKFIIIGVIENTSTSIIISGNNLVVPLTVAEPLWPKWGAYINQFLISYSPDIAYHNITENIRDILRRKYPITPQGSDRFRLINFNQQINTLKMVISFFSFVLFGIAMISLLVGGAGIMNIMLYSIRKEQKEIGVRMAIGASRKDIQKQFLIEAVF